MQAIIHQHKINKKQKETDEEQVAQIHSNKNRYRTPNKTTKARDLTNVSHKSKTIMKQHR